MSMGESGSIFAYAGMFQKPLAFEISSEVRAAANLLEKNFRLKRIFFYKNILRNFDF